MNSNKLSLAWCAGFLDGEGTIYQNNNTAYVYVWQKEYDVLDRFKRIVGAGKIYNRRIIKTPGGKDTTAYVYYVGGQNGIEVLRGLLPYLFVKRDKAINAIERRKHMKRKPYKQTC